ASHPELPILPDDVAAAVDQDHPVVDAALLAVLGDAGRDAGARHEREIADALGVVGADDRVRRGVARAVAELPDDVATWVDLDHPVVELIGDELPWLLKPLPTAVI